MVVEAGDDELAERLGEGGRELRPSRRGRGKGRADSTGFYSATHSPTHYYYSYCNPLPCTSPAPPPFDCQLHPLPSLRARRFASKGGITPPSPLASMGIQVSSLLISLLGTLLTSSPSITLYRAC